MWLPTLVSVVATVLVIGLLVVAFAVRRPEAHGFQMIPWRSTTCPAISWSSPRQHFASLGLLGVPFIVLATTAALALS
jgi:hypothetical protein